MTKAVERTTKVVEKMIKEEMVAREEEKKGAYRIASCPQLQVTGKETHRTAGTFTPASKCTSSWTRARIPTLSSR